MTIQGYTKTSTRARRASRVTLRGLAALSLLGLLLLSPAAAGAAPARVDVNSATVEQLAALPGIGASKAAAIVAEREVKPFASVDDLERVKGIGAKTLTDLRARVTVGNSGK